MLQHRPEPHLGLEGSFARGPHSVSGELEGVAAGLTLTVPAQLPQEARQFPRPQ